MAMTGEPLIEVTVPASVEEVWAHLRDPALIRRWFGWEYDGLTREIEIIFVEEAQADERARTIAWDHGDRIELDPAGDETVLRFSHPFPDAAAGAHDDVGEGWIGFVQQLRFALTRHPGEERRTHYLSADAALPVVEAVEATGGEVWFRSPHQLGVVAPDLGDGLLIAMEKPGAAAFLTLTAYGDDDGALEASVARWEAWFNQRVG
jgi:uncharacterized protein YndB with AHSA1/START domain